MRDLETFELDARGVAYIRNQFSDRGEYSASLKAFGAALDNVVAAERGRVLTTAPVGTSQSRLYEFEVGGLLPENLDMSRAIDVGGSFLLPVENLFDVAFAHLRARLQRERNLVCVVADPMPRKGDEALSGYESTALYVDESVYHLIDAETPEEAADLAIFASPFWSNLVVISPRRPTLTAERTTSADEVARSGASAVEIYVSAYDGEGFVVWRRADG